MKTFLFKPLLLSAFLLLQISWGFAQDEDQNQDLDNGPLVGQFDYIMKKSETYEAYKVVKITSLRKIKSNVLDSVKNLKSTISELETQSETQKNEINSLKSDLKDTNDKLNQITKEKESFSFLGFLMKKSSYNLMVWTIVLVLTVAFVVMFFLFKQRHSVTAKTKQALIEKQEEFDAHRKWALEREQTLARDLNKLKQKYKGLD